jgi:hypothetical protein
MLMLPLMLAVPAQADEHFQEYFGGVSRRSVTFHGSAAFKIPWIEPAAVPAKHSIFGFGEVGWHVAGTGSGHRLESVLGGLRYRTCGNCRIEPFGHGMLGAERPHRQADTDAPTDISFAWGFGIGADLELNVDKASGLVPAFRVQVDRVMSMTSPGFDSYFRATFGFVGRIEP